jgi:hypothetical protein
VESYITSDITIFYFSLDSPSLFTKLGAFRCSSAFFIMKIWKTQLYEWLNFISGSKSIHFHIMIIILINYLIFWSIKAFAFIRLWLIFLQCKSFCYVWKWRLPLIIFVYNKQYLFSTKFVSPNWKHFLFT